MIRADHIMACSILVLLSIFLKEKASIAIPKNSFDEFFHIRLVDVLRQDREENAEVAMKILRALAPSTHSSKHRTLMQFSPQIASACQLFIQGPRPGEDGAQHQAGADNPHHDQYA